MDEYICSLYSCSLNNGGALESADNLQETLFTVAQPLVDVHDAKNRQQISANSR